MPKDVGNTQDLVALKEIRDNTVILKNGSLRQIVMVSGINFALKSDMEQNILTQSYQNFLNSIDFPLQVVIHSRKVNVERYLDELSAYEEAEASPLLRSQAGEYKEFVRSFVQKNAIMEKTFLVVVPFTPIGLPSLPPVVASPLSFLPFLKRKGAEQAAQEEKAKERAEKNFQEALLQLKQRVSQVLEGLLGMGLEAVLLQDEQLIELFYNFYNPESVERARVEAAQAPAGAHPQ